MVPSVCSTLDDVASHVPDTQFRVTDYMQQCSQQEGSDGKYAARIRGLYDESSVWTQENADPTAPNSGHPLLGDYKTYINRETISKVTKTGPNKTVTNGTTTTVVHFGIEVGVCEE